MIEWIIFALLGIVAGLFSGLLGLGGGLIIVPILLIIFSWQGLAASQLMHVAVGTSLMTITVTSLFSLYAHHRHNNINWLVLKRLVPGLMLGAIVGAYFATMLSSQFLQQFFAAYTVIVAVRVWLPMSKSSNEYLLNKGVLYGTGGLVGSISALAGIGGGSLIVPYLLMAKQSIQRAIGTSAACGLPISIAAVSGFLVFGHSPENNNTVWQTGFIHWQAFLGIISTSSLFAVIGVKLAKKLPVTILRRLFSGILLLVAVYLL